MNAKTSLKCKNEGISEQKDDDSAADSDEDDHDGDTFAEAADAAAAHSQKYIALLQKKRVCAADLVTGKASGQRQKHAYEAMISKDTATRSAKSTKRVQKELKRMKKHLPVGEGASIFLCFDKNKPYVMRALISGPVDTPYERVVCV